MAAPPGPGDRGPESQAAERRHSRRPPLLTDGTGSCLRSPGEIAEAKFKPRQVLK